MWGKKKKKIENGQFILMCKIWSPNVGTSFDFADKDV
jgi:hypothetical protein